MLRLVSEPRPEERQAREGAREVVAQQVQVHVLLSASEEPDRGNYSVPTPPQCPFSRATIRCRPSQEAPQGHPSPKITRPLVPGNHIWHDTCGHLALQAQKVEDDLDQVELEAHVRQTEPEVSLQEQGNHLVMAALQVLAGFLWARVTTDEDDISVSYKTTNLGRATFLESLPLSNRADDASFPFGLRLGPTVRGFARGDTYCVTLVLVILLNCFIFDKFDLSSLLFLLSVIDAVARSQTGTRKEIKTTHVGVTTKLMPAEVN